MPGEYLKTAGEFLVVAAKPQSGWLGKSKEKQTPYIQIRFMVEEGIEAGQEITWFGYLSDAAIERTIETLVKVFGFNGDLNALYAGKQTFEGMQARITVEAESYQGKDRWKVKWLNPVEYDGRPSLESEEALTLIAGLNKRTKAFAAAALNELPKKPDEKQKALKEKEPPPVSPDDDVPF